MLPVVDLVPWLFVLAGILLLGWGASWLVDGASRLALHLGVSPFVVGLTVVGFGTSMPEFTVSVLAATRGSGGLSLGNAVGSNIMNLILVLGVAGVLAPISVRGARRILWRDLLFGLAPAAILLATARDGTIERHWAVALIIVFIVFIVTCVVQARDGPAAPTVVSGHPLRHLAWTVIGIAILVTGSEMMVRGGVDLARSFGVSEAVIGLTLVAFGTSLPELATSVAAALKGQSEISVGNVLGSNVFNLGLIVGTAFVIRPAAVPVFVITQDIPFLIGVTLVVGLVVLRDTRIGRLEGGAMLGLFAAYLVFVAIRGA
jgi:cation:H+ antiporter